MKYLLYCKGGVAKLSSVLQGLVDDKSVERVGSVNYMLCCKGGVDELSAVLQGWG